MKQYVDKISELIKHKGIRHEIHSFDSGAFMVDVWINKDFYCIQLDENKFGISKVTEDIDFSTIPDKEYSEWRNFKIELEKVIEDLKI
ncbi:hypothetical protein OD91_2226 [Lutibacter sp. Hel_I_33_5]|uniref:hypothetical protein n=1 Tax=Lutibacter sp. Hel_I_33_5 TaxID=1566289 RepID=UPI0011A1E587|nr:hypothetical protein [Lutibacter sp. Hel_I_33_5]TVZ56924.1 hypothetical protein OD91_2226 [Lutibacter sp. Hel_I_33_5]